MHIFLFEDEVRELVTLRTREIRQEYLDKEKELKEEFLKDVKKREEELDNKITKFKIVQDAFEIEKKQKLQELKLTSDEENFTQLQEKQKKIDKLEAETEAQKGMIKFLESQKDKGMLMSAADLKGLALTLNSRVGSEKDAQAIGMLLGEAEKTPNKKAK